MPEDLAVPSSLSASIKNSRIAAPLQPSFLCAWFRGRSLLEPIVRTVPQRDERRMMAYRDESRRGSDYWSPWREPTYRLMFNPFNSSEETISCGKFRKPTTEASVAHGRLHNIYIARIMAEQLVECEPWYERSELPVRTVVEGTEEYNRIFGQHYVVFGFDERGANAPDQLPKYIKTAARPTKKELKLADSLTGTAREIRGITVEGGGEEEEEGGEEERETRAPRAIKHEEEISGEDKDETNLLDHIIDVTPENHSPLDHTDLVALRRLHADDPTALPLELFTKNVPVVEAAEELGIPEKTLQKRKDRFMRKALMQADRPSGIPYVDTPEEIYEGIIRGEVYLLLNAGNGWRHHHLDTKTHGTIDRAVEALKQEKIRAAWDRNDLRKRTQYDFIGNKFKRKEERDRLIEIWDKRFNDAFVVRDPGQWPHWRGLLGTEI